MGKSKRCTLIIFATFRALVCPDKEMTWIVGTSGELAYKKTTCFFIQLLNLYIYIVCKGLRSLLLTKIYFFQIFKETRVACLMEPLVKYLIQIRKS